MDKRSYLISIITLVLVFFSFSLVSAEIIISQPSSLYNLGDDFQVNIAVSKTVDTNDFLVVRFSCAGNEVELYRSPLSLKPSETKNVNLTAKLDRSLLSNINGECNIKAIYADEEYQSNSFKISDKIDLTINVRKSIVDPGQEILITGIAKKENGNKVNGFVEVYLEGTGISSLMNINSNEFNATLLLPSNIAANTFKVVVNAYEKEYSGEQTNQGSASTYIKVNQIIKKVEIALNKNIINPSENISFTLIVHDQAGNEVHTSVDNVILYPNKSVYSSTKINSFQSNIVPMSFSSEPGFWSIESLGVKKEFEINTLEKINFSYNNQTLSLKNIGNVVYDNEVRVSVGEETIVISELMIPVNGYEDYIIESKYAGDFSILVNADNQTSNLGIVQLSKTPKSVFAKLFSITGAAIGLKEVDKENQNSNLNFILWMLIILALLLLVVYYYTKVRKNKFYGLVPPLDNFKSSYSGNIKSLNPFSTHMNMEKANINKDEPKPTTTMFQTYEPNVNARESYNSQSPSGKKEEVVVFALKIKNAPKLIASQSSAFLAIDNALHKAKMAKGRVFDQGQFKLVVFSKTISPKVGAIESLKIATEIDKLLNDFNKKYAIKIDYGIGMNTGEMLFEMSEGKPKFTSIGNTIVLAKNAADKAGGCILLSQPLFRKVFSVVKAELTSNGLYKLNSFSDRSSHSEFINKFMKKDSNSKV